MSGAQAGAEELWATLSVADHLRRRAFVAEALLYDRIVAPIPPEGDREARGEWAARGWNPARQRRLLNILGPRRVVEIPWSAERRALWRDRRAMADGAAYDARALAAMRAEMGEDDPAVVSREAAGVTRIVLCDAFSHEGDAALLARLPRIRPRIVAGYGSHRAFSAEHPENRDAELSLVFGWSFLVPDGSGLSDEDALRAAIDLSSGDASRALRARVRDWREGWAPAELDARALRLEMESLIADQEAEARRLKLSTVRRYGFAAGLAGGGAAAALIGDPMLGVGAAAMIGVAQLALGDANAVTGEPAAAVLFHDARRRFGWRAPR